MVLPPTQGDFNPQVGAVPPPEDVRSNIMQVYSEQVPGQQFAEMDELVRLGYIKASQTAWLELRTTLPGQVAGVRRYLIGAVNKPGRGWEPIQPGAASGGTLVPLSGNFADPDEVHRFQQAILDSWGNSSGLSDLAKGTTFGKSFTSASFVAKALKTGLDAVGKPMSAGPKFTTWSIDDLLKYTRQRACARR